jgi:hypothetical protein
MALGVVVRELAAAMVTGGEFFEVTGGDAAKAS